MATQTITQTSQAKPTKLPLETVQDRVSAADAPYWMKEIHTKGWTVVRNTISEDKARVYSDKAYSWLEDWGYGYDRNDPSTRKPSKLPYHHRGGLYNRLGIAHEQFVWDLKCEPEIIDKFAQIWGTDELVVSYDGLNLSIPEKERPKTDIIYVPWSHVDQSPLRKNLQCVQGILNLLPNGPDDGGLMVLEGSNSLYTQLWEHFDHKKGEKGWNTHEQEFLDEEMCDWLIAQGCKWVKVCAGPGDLLLWDSRTVHYGSPPTLTNDRFAAYVCYKPASHLTEESIKQRLELWEQKTGSAHDPSIVRATIRLPPDDHHSYTDAANRPLQSPVLSEKGKKLASLESY